MSCTTRGSAAAFLHRHQRLRAPQRAGWPRTPAAREGARLLSLDPGPETVARAPVAFDRGVCDRHDEVALLTWGSPLETSSTGSHPVERGAAV